MWNTHYELWESHRAHVQSKPGLWVCVTFSASSSPTLPPWLSSAAFWFQLDPLPCGNVWDGFLPSFVPEPTKKSQRLPRIKWRHIRGREDSLLQIKNPNKCFQWGNMLLFPLKTQIGLVYICLQFLNKNKFALVIIKSSPQSSKAAINHAGTEHWRLISNVHLTARWHSCAPRGLE